MSTENTNQIRQVHMANERTFLSWISTSLGIIAFGFVIERFALFMKQMAVLLGKDLLNSSSAQGIPTVVGIFLVAFGTITSLLAFIKYRDVQKQIEANIWRSASMLDLMITTVVFSAGMVLVFYLIRNAVG